MRSTFGNEGTPDTNAYDSDDAPANSDNGLDPAAIADYASDGVLSAIMTIDPAPAEGGPEPIDDDDLGPEEHGVFDKDENSNLTMDFGFYPALNLGNRVWRDDNNNGIFDSGEPGIGGVSVHLYDSTGTTLIATETTAAGTGYYRFDELAPGEYTILIDSENFNTGNAGVDALENMLSSTTTEASPNTNIDNDDNGIDDTDPFTNGGIWSGVVTLSATHEPTGETSPDNVSGSSDDRGVLDDNHSNLSVDFGFIPVLSLGDQLWFDTDNNGLFDDGAGSGVGAGVIVNLLDENGNFIKATTTNADGEYLFENLNPGNYIVEVDESNFDSGKTLEHYTSSTGAEADPNLLDDNDNDNGLDDFAPATNGIRSGVVELIAYTEPTDDGDASDLSNLSVDFGFVQAVSLGNRVWFDTDGNSAQNGVELGIARVDVQLFRSGQIPGTDTPISTTTTDTRGYYLFDNLQPGAYFVWIADTNFGAGRPLSEKISSLDSSTGAEADPDSDGDQNDNGRDNAFPAINGIQSADVTLTADGNEPVDGVGATNEKDRDPTPTLPAGNPTAHGSVADDHSNLTVDFGFFEPVALGNIVWLDDGAGASGVSNDGRMNGSEAGIDDVTVDLYRVEGSSEIYIGSDTTENGGYYLFDNLVPGAYFVKIPNTEFNGTEELRGMLSSQVTETEPDDDGDHQTTDNGLDDLEPFTNGIRTGTITLIADREPTGETDLEAGVGQGSVDDNNSNVTLDLGFFMPLSLGNRIWFDDGGPGGGGTPYDGQRDDGDEFGVPAGVLVNLLDSAGTTVIATTTDRCRRLLSVR